MYDKKKKTATKNICETGELLFFLLLFFKEAKIKLKLVSKCENSNRQMRSQTKQTKHT